MDRISQLIKRYQLLGWPLVSIVISLLLLVFIIIPQLLGIKSTQDSIAQLNTRVGNLNAKANSLNSVDTKSYQDNLNVALIVLPTDKDIPSAIGQIQTLLANNNLQLNGMSFAHSDTPPSAALQNYQIKIDVTSDQNSLKNLVNSLKGAPQIMQVTTLDITGDQRTSSLDSTLTLEIFYQGLPTALGDLEQPVSPLTQADTSLLADLQKRTQGAAQVSSVNLGPRGKANPFQ